MLQLVVGQLLNGIIVGTLYGIIALGVTLTFGITGIVNFALGAFMMLGAYVTWYLTDGIGLPYPLAVPLAVVFIALFGLVVDQALFRFTRNNLINGLIVSIGLISVIVAVVLMIWTTTPQEHALRSARRAQDRRRHRAPDEGRRVRRPAARDPLHVRAR